DFYRYVVSDGAARAQFELQGGGGAVSLLARRAAVASVAAHDFASFAGSNAPLITLLNGPGPFSLQPGEWFVSAVNTSSTPADYTIMASDFPIEGTNILITGQTLVATGTNASDIHFCLNWNSLDGVYYYIEAKVALNAPVWTTLQGKVTGVDGQTTWCVPL